MADNWVDWECEDNQASAVPSAERIKQLQERKLIEEADNALTCELFNVPHVGVVALAETKQTTKKKKLARPLTKVQRS